MKMQIRAASLGHPRLWVAAAAIMACGVATLALAPGAMAKEKAKETKAKSKSAPKAESSVKSGGGYLGVYMQDLSEEVRQGLDVSASTKGVLINGVEQDSPAEKAGIEEGDIIVKFDGDKVATADQLRDAVRGMSPGADATVELLHNGKPATLTVTLGEREQSHFFSYETPEGEMTPAPMDMGRGFAFFGGPRLGVQAHEIEDDGLASYFGVKSGDGVLVLGVEKNSVAGKAGVEPGDVIREVGEDKIGDVNDLRKSVRDYDAGDEFTITVLRHGKAQSLKATMDEDQMQAFRMPADMHWRGFTQDMPSPRVRVHTREVEQDLRQEMDELRQEIRELKDRLDRKDG